MPYYNIPLKIHQILSIKTNIITESKNCGMWSWSDSGSFNSIPKGYHGVFNLFLKDFRYFFISSVIVFIIRISRKCILYGVFTPRGLNLLTVFRFWYNNRKFAIYHFKSITTYWSYEYHIKIKTEFQTNRELRILTETCHINLFIFTQP